MDKPLIISACNFVRFHNYRNSDGIRDLLHKDAFISYSNGIESTEMFFESFPNVYWLVEESSYSESDSNESQFYVTEYWKESGSKEHHYACKIRFILWDRESMTILRSWEEVDNSRSLSIRERRKLKRKAIKFHGKRKEEAKNEQKRVEEGERWRQEGDVKDAKDREKIREQKREYWRKKHEKFELKRQQKDKIQKRMDELSLQEAKAWESKEGDPDKWAMPRVLIDLSFLSTMDQFASSSILNQLAGVYNRNLKAEFPFRIYLASHESERLYFDALISKQGSMESWVGFSMHPTIEVYDLLPESSLPIIYLSPDAEEILESVDENHLYVIGGLCDRDRKRNVTKDKCDKLGLQSRRLPIDEYVSLNGSKILTINSVFSILCSWMETKSWSEAFSANLRKKSLVRIKKACDNQVLG